MLCMQDCNFRLRSNAVAFECIIVVGAARICGVRAYRDIRGGGVVLIENSLKDCWDADDGCCTNAISDHLYAYSKLCVRVNSCGWVMRVGMPEQKSKRVKNIVKNVKCMICK